MKRKIVIIVIIAVVALLVFAGVRQVIKSRAELAQSITQIHSEMGVPVEVTQVKIADFALSHSYLGTVEGVLQNSVSASIVEEIVDIPVEVGDRVKKGDVVCRLDAKASRAQYQQLKLAYEDAKLDAERMERLYEAGAISKQNMEKAQLNRDVMKENLETSSQTVALTAPFDGIVTDVLFRPGETTEMGKPVVKIADLNRVKIKFTVNYDDWKQINKATPVYLQINGNGDGEILAEISDIAISADTKSRLFNVWVEAKNESGIFQPGLLVDARVVVALKPDAVIIPRDAHITRDEVNGVFVVGDDKRVVFTAFNSGRSNSEVIEVIDGLTPGQTIVTYGHNNLEDGKLVKIIDSKTSTGN